MASYYDSTAIASHGAFAYLLQEREKMKMEKANAKQSLSITRRFTLAWKRITRATRKPERASVLPDGFVIVASRRRRSIFWS